MSDAPKASRRTLLQGGLAAGLGLSAGVLAEALSLAGRFDNRVLPARQRGDAWTDSHDALQRHDAALLHVAQSTHLLSLGGLRVLTDPWFYDPAFGSLIHPRLPVRPEQIGTLDAILITHDHPDHADRRALDRLDKSASVIVGVPDLVAPLRKLGFAFVEHLPTWASLKLGAATITATPALHDVQEAGFIVDANPHAVYFAGDTALHGGLREIAERWSLSLAILPIDGTRIRWERRLVMDPHDAATATALLSPRRVMSSHADAGQSDWLARHVLSETAATPHATFRARVAEVAPRVICETPPPGGVFSLA